MDTTGFHRVRTFTASLLIHHGIILLLFMGPVMPQSCSTTTNLSENSTFHSPGYPSNYMSSTECSWSITVSEGTVAVLRFVGFRLESCSNCGCDYVIVYDGSDSTSPQLAKVCGSNVPAPIYATNNRMFVKFRSDGSVVYTGFSAKVSSGELISEYIESENGTIESPNFPNNYEPDKRYLWNITVPENYQIILEFLSFELQENSGCTADFVVVRDGPDQASPILGRVCGTNVEKYMRTTGNRMTISLQTDDTVQEKGFSVQFRKAEICGSTIEGTSGNVNSPNYPSNYGPVERCQWKIVAPPDHHILFRFLTFNIALSDLCAKDFVRIYNGNDTSASYLGKFCGMDTPNVTKSTSSIIVVEFQSDSTEEAQGFSARFETDFCGEEFHSDSGTFQSPNYPNPYNFHEMCSWKIIVTEGYRIVIRFDSFNLESSYRCNSDSVRVFDGLNETNTELLKLCGDKTSKRKVYSSGNTMSVRFVTDASYSKSGFSASYLKVALPISDNSSVPSVPCQQDIRPAESGIISSPRYPEWYSPGIDCIWNIEVPEGNVIRMQFDSFNVEDDPFCTFDYVTVYDGPSPTSSRLGKYCGTTIPEPEWSTFNKMSVKFVTDSSFEHPGFSAVVTKVEYLEHYVSGERGTIQSPNYPNNYGPSQKRVWRITVPSNHKILLKFLTFDLEFSQNCTDDFVRVHNGDSTSSVPIGTFCGSSPPGDMRSSENKLTVVFGTDSSGEEKGFSAKFEKEAICGTDSCRNGGTCARSRGTYRCTCKHGYRGDLCDEKILCTNGTCENGGSCFQNGSDGIINCVCTHGYEGVLCHERILCGNQTCRNGGYCTHGGKNGVFMCVCERGFEGLLCEKTVEKSSSAVVSIVVPVVIILVIASAVVLYLLLRKRLKRQVTQPYKDMKQAETFFDKEETLE